jgi:hypothetical protein
MLRYSLIACAILGAFYSFLLARAAWLFEQDTASSVPKAVELVPYNSAYLSRLAAWRSNDKVALLQQAVSLNPFDFESLIQLGFDQEFRKRDIQQAERFYLRAAVVNQMFLPKWTLTNFYFRHARLPEFFRWANAALAITPFSAEPIFVQMWLLSQDADRISRAIPERPRILLPYAWFLSNNQKQDPIGPIVHRLVQAVGKLDPHNWGRDDLLAVIEDRLVAAGNRDTALSVWSSMANARWIPQTVPDTTHPVTNGDFRLPFYQHGFDWTELATPGIHTDQIPSDKLVRFYFSGDEPEQCSLFQQYIPLEAGRAYDLHWHIDSGLPEGPSGLHWHLTPISKAPSVELVSDDLAESKNPDWQFHAPLAAKIALLTLGYQRPLGQIRARGTVLLKDVSSRAE